MNTNLQLKQRLLWLVVVATAGLVWSGSLSDAQSQDDGSPLIKDTSGTLRTSGIGVNLGFYARLLNEDGRVFKKGYRTSRWSAKHQPFNPAFLKLFEPFEAIRYHQTHLVSFSQEREWSDRALSTVDLPITEADLESINSEDVKVPYEWEIRLCNVTNTDLWITVPHMASRDYLNSLARLIHENLDSDLKVYVEYSNEVWNHFYSDGGAWDPTVDEADGQYTYALENGRKAFGDIMPEDSWGDWGPISYWYAHASIQAWHAFESVLGRERVYRVLAWITPEAAENWNSMQLLLDALDQDEVRTVNGQVVSMRPEVFAVNPYFNGPFKDDEPLPSANWDDYRNSIKAIETNLAYTRRILNDRGYEGSVLMGYEGGQHITTPQWNPVETNRNPEMYDIYRDWLKITGRHLELNMHYSLVTPFTSGEAFGLKEYIHQRAEEAHKWRAVMDYARQLKDSIASGNN